jgi:uncharacterized protein YgiM (DUF1202 family)
MRMRTFAVALVAVAVVAAAAAAADRSPDEPGTYVTNRTASLYARPSADSNVVRKLRANTVIEVVRVTDQWYEVRSTHGNPNGYIRRSYAEPYAGRGGHRRVFRKGIFQLTSPVVMHEQANSDSPRVTHLGQGAEVRIVDKDGVWYRVESESGDKPGGWIPTMAAKRVRDLDEEETSGYGRSRSHGTPSDEEQRSRSYDGERDRERDLDDQYRDMH